MLIVVGYKNIQVQEVFGKKYRNISIFYVTNDCYESSGSAYSFFLTHDFWSKTKPPILMLHADLLYDRQVLVDTLERPQTDLIVLDEAFEELTGDELVVIGEVGKVEALFKGPDGKDNIQGESLGINKWSAGYLEKYYVFLRDFLKKNGRNCNWEPTISEFLLAYPDVQLNYSGIDGKYWINVNYQDDVEYATKVVLEQIRR